MSRMRHIRELKDGDRFKYGNKVMEVVSEAGEDGIYFGIQQIIKMRKKNTVLAVDIHKRHEISHYDIDELVEYLPKKGVISW